MICDPCVERPTWIAPVWSAPVWSDYAWSADVHALHIPPSLFHCPSVNFFCPFDPPQREHTFGISTLLGTSTLRFEYLHVQHSDQTPYIIFF